MLKERLSIVMHHQVYQYTKIKPCRFPVLTLLSDPSNLVFVLFFSRVQHICEKLEKDFSNNPHVNNPQLQAMLYGNNGVPALCTTVGTWGGSYGKQ